MNGPPIVTRPSRTAALLFWGAVVIVGLLGLGFIFVAPRLPELASQVRRIRQQLAAQRQAPIIRTEPAPTKSVWSRLPNAADMDRFYPVRANALQKEGLVVLMCRVRPDGALDPCRVAREDPGGYGFGDAALKLSTIFRMKTVQPDGHPVVGTEVRIPIRYRLPRD